jgi:hypothetical protein
VLKAAVDQYPVIGPQLQKSIGQPGPGRGSRSPVAAIGIFIGALGVSELAAERAQLGVGDPLCPPPRVPVVRAAQRRLIIVIGVGFIGTTIISGIAAGAGRILPGAGSSVLFYAVRWC